MGFEIRRRMSAVAASILTVVATTASLSIVGLAAAGPSSADTLDDCPATIPPSSQVDNQIGASYSVSGTTATYKFSSFVNENPSGGIPGLIEYCVFTNPLPNSSAVASGLAGGNGMLWKTSGDASNYFGFIRPDGDPSNIPLNGTTGITMGTGTWSGGVPASQTIVLHINDPAECAALGEGANTCYVHPGSGNQDLTVTKTATPSFTRTYTWGIGKDVDKTTQDIAAGGSATFDYTVNVTHDTGTDGNWQVTGHITVKNPNPDAFNGVNVSDSIDNGGSCTVAPGGPGGTVDPSNATIPASGSVDFPYTCTYASAPSPSGFTNTGMAAWSKAAYNTPDGSATGTATGDFANVTPTITDGSVDVTDTLGGDLGSASYTDPSPKSFTYSHTFTGDPAGTCTTHHNIATFTTSDTNTTGSASKSVQVCVGADLTATKTATPSFTRTYTWGITKSVDNTKLTIADGGSATFTYTVAVTHDTGTDSNWQVSGDITVSNPNDFEAVTTNVADSINNGGNCTITGGSTATIPASGSVDFPYTCTYSTAPNPSGFTNTGTATWDSSAAHTPDSSATATATGDFAKVTPKIVDGSVDVTDTFGGDLGPVSYTDPSPMNLTYSHTFTGDPAGTCTHHDNTATFTTSDTNTTGSARKSVQVCVGADLTASKSATPSFTRTYTWGITKGVDTNLINIPQGGSATFNYSVGVTHDTGTDSNWQVNGDITVSNPNDFEAVTTNVADSINNGGNCTITGGSTATIPASGSVDFPYTCTYSTAPSPTGFTNTGTATWDSTAASTPDGSTTATATGDFAKVTPNIVDGSVDVTDTLGGHLGSASYTDPSPKNFTYSHTFTGDPAGTCTTHDNIATFTTSDTNTSGSASKSVEVCVGADLTATKTATPSFTRTYNWDIAKQATPTLIEQLGGGTASASYKVTVNQDTTTPFTDSNWKVKGKVTVTNPNDFEAVTTNVADSINNGGNCTVTGGTNAVVPASTSVDFNYTCTYTSAPAPSSFTNTGTATWDSSAAHTPDSSATATATGDFANVTPAFVNKTITVMDSYAGLLGTVTATDTPPFASNTFTYSRTFTVPANNCVKYPNTATIVETGQSASQSVEVCGPAKTGALTMGFWQNKNGQGIITGGSSTSGVCNSGTWLRRYTPFQDLSSSASCSAVATYVFNIIKAANAGGATMNAMLKAQMLATALDVYFSDPGLGGNKIGAPVPIGGVSVDLTKICHMIDSSSGGSCSGSNENVSSAFGGSSSLTVSQMLSYAASQSNVGGSTWYGNVKATQQLAKDAFDATNNQVVFSP